ncbi:MAG TPA: coenzyme F420-0:L-glutamate ligase [Solirubrobacteraceae bacterium]|nr:coenzyme F420-0:L-glutamate ligase [Solirubrobacteraceae bacterium]
MSEIRARSLPGLPEIAAGDDLAELIALTAGAAESVAPGSGAGGGDGAPGTGLRDGEIVAIAHKAVSKAEGAVVALAGVVPSPRAREMAATLSAEGDGRERDPRVIQAILDQSSEVVRAQRGVLICRTHHGFVCANAGVDASNAADDASNAAAGASNAGVDASNASTGGEGERLIVLPADPDASARRLRARLRELTGARVAVLITDSFGRAWRQGQCDVALGCAGMAPLDDWRGRSDGSGRELTATVLAVADAAAAAADLARAKDSREPVVIISGLERFVTDDDGPGAGALLRALEEDLFR